MDIHCTMWNLLSKPRMAGCMSAAIFQRENAFPPSFHVWFVWSFTHRAKLGSVWCTHTERCEAKQAPGIEETCRRKNDDGTTISQQWQNVSLLDREHTGAEIRVRSSDPKLSSTDHHACKLFIYAHCLYQFYHSPQIFSGRLLRNYFHSIL